MCHVWNAATDKGQVASSQSDSTSCELLKGKQSFCPGETQNSLFSSPSSEFQFPGCQRQKKMFLGQRYFAKLSCCSMHFDITLRTDCSAKGFFLKQDNSTRHCLVKRKKKVIFKSCVCSCFQDFCFAFFWFERLCLNVLCSIKYQVCALSEIQMIVLW